VTIARLPALLLLATLAVSPSSAQGMGQDGGGALRLVERSDYSRYANGRYVGHVYRESRGSLAPAPVTEGAPGTLRYAGEYYVLEETLRDMRSAARKVDRSEPVSFLREPSGALRFDADPGFPSLRGLPSFPDAVLSNGLAWIAPGERALDFEGSGSFLRLPFLAEYRCTGPVEYSGRAAIGIRAKFATRYKAPQAAAGRAGTASVPIQAASGTHDLDIIVDAATRETLFIRDRFDDSFVLAAGGTERRAGFCLFFYEGTSALDRVAAESLVRASVALTFDTEGRSVGAGPGPIVSESGEAALAGDPADQALAAGAADSALAASGIELDQSEAGLVLRVKDLRFIADSEEILPSERWRLDALASALKVLSGRNFLVEGHSASVGKAAGELELSLRRAKRVADELVARGIEPGRIMYKGYGSTRPIASNDSEEGRARNRRVEVTVLEY
jgi:outer membrane protein OmpA-like peptidoglycan-associated protein